MKYEVERVVIEKLPSGYWNVRCADTGTQEVILNSKEDCTTYAVSNNLEIL